MASDENMTPQSSMYSSMHDLDVDGYYTDDDDDDDDDDDYACLHDMYDDDEEDSQEGDHLHMNVQMSSLSLETWDGDGADANAQLSDHVDDKGEPSDCDGGGGHHVTWFSTDHQSLPGTPTRCAGPTKEYASESDAVGDSHAGRARRKRSSAAAAAASDLSSSSYSYHYRRSGRTRERRLDRAWEVKRCHRAGGAADGGGPGSGSCSPCIVVRPSGPGASCMRMDMEEVKACRDLGLELPCDWTVEIPPDALTASATSVDTGSSGGGGNSPTGNWRISSPGDDPGDMKARLRVWAQAVALASASRLSS